MTTTSPAAGSGRRPTSQDVARLAGLSQSAVSQILNVDAPEFAGSGKTPKLTSATRRPCV